jgi:hypothetical protein
MIDGIEIDRPLTPALSLQGERGEWDAAFLREGGLGCRRTCWEEV